MAASEMNDIEFEFLPFFRVYKNGHVERLAGTGTVHPSPCDPATGVASKDVVIDPTAPVSVRLYLPASFPVTAKLPLLVYFHGGAFCIESAFSPTYHSYLNSVASRGGVLVVSVDYRLAPEHPLPVAYDDSWAALRWAMAGLDPWVSERADLERVFLGGDSAGANIVHRMAVRAGMEGGMRVEGLALVHPYFSTGQEPVGSTGDQLWRLVCPGAKAGTGDPWLNPAAAEGEDALARMAGRRAIVFVAERDVLREKGMAYYELVKGSGWGGELELVETKGEGHVFHLLNPGSNMADGLMDKLLAFLAA